MSRNRESNAAGENLELTGIQWLLDHHGTKEQERRGLVDDLNLRPGNVVLDLGCGPGLWSSLFAAKIKPNGRVIGVDGSTELLRYAEGQLQCEPLKELISYRRADFPPIPLDAKTVDLVFFANCLSYIPDHHKILNEHKRVTKQGGRIVVKDFDGANIVFHPIDPILTQKILLAASRALTHDQVAGYFDIFAGRKLHGLFLESGLKNVCTKTYAIQKLAPLTPVVKRYMVTTGEWYAGLAKPYLSEEDYAQWRAHFDPTSDEYVLNRNDFYFSMIEVLTVGTLVA